MHIFVKYISKTSRCINSRENTMDCRAPHIHAKGLQSVAYLRWREILRSRGLGVGYSPVKIVKWGIGGRILRYGGRVEEIYEKLY